MGYEVVEIGVSIGASSTNALVFLFWLTWCCLLSASCFGDAPLRLSNLWARKRRS